MALSAKYPDSPSRLTLRRIAELSDLPGDWNGHGAQPIPADSCKAAIHLLENAWAALGSSVPQPTVIAPTSDGGVALEWIVQVGGEERGIEVVCFPGGRYEYSIRNRKTGALNQDGEDATLHTVLVNVIKPHVSGHFILAR